MIRGRLVPINKGAFGAELRSEQSEDDWKWEFARICMRIASSNQDYLS